MNFNRIAVIGAKGQVGTALCDRLKERAIAFSSAEADLRDPESLCNKIAACNPDAVINAGAYTKVDKAESEPELCYAINAAAPGIIAKWCAEQNIPFIHYSTDYVFDGSKDMPWQEDDFPAPLNVYGSSKWQGEQAVSKAGGNHLIFRISWVYDAFHPNFLTTMLRLGAEREILQVVADQFGAPGYAPHIATATINSLDKALIMSVFPSGIYHMANGGKTSWHGFAEAIFALAKEKCLPLSVKTVEPISALSYAAIAKRPENSCLDVKKLKMVFAEQLPDWQTGLRDAMEVIRASHCLPY